MKFPQTANKRLVYDHTQGCMLDSPTHRMPPATANSQQRYKNTGILCSLHVLC